ncbi:hypothetical protein EGT67_17465 [Prescottella agglutinans]|uniref:Uncharacterized protein n=1 Tax=Prescottella agglutinans TaxID=1644129 RepID=A0A438BBU4_9NOCA|nr:hypothetical protein [Prescottella agglutinans]RVW08195.1 hypothetical protein EGT67_17465 [Prescottella agglutinans]
MPATHVRTRWTVARWAISSVGIARVLYGILPLALLANGFEAGTGIATAVLATIGVGFVVQGAAMTALARMLSDIDAAVIISVALDALVTVLAISSMVAGWNDLTAAAGLVVLGAVVLAGVSAVIVAMTSTQS